MRGQEYLVLLIIGGLYGIYMISPMPGWFQHQSDQYYMDKAMYMEQYSKIDLVKSIESKDAQLNQCSNLVTNTQDSLSTCQMQQNSAWGGLNAFFAIMTFVWGFAIGIVLLRWFTDREIKEKDDQIVSMGNELMLLRSKSKAKSRSS